MIFLLLKSLIFLITLFFSLILFSLKVIGGGDGKLIIIIFLIHPTMYLKISYIFLFFLILSTLFLIFFFTNYLSNSVTKISYSFDIFFNLGFKISILKKLFIRMFYTFLSFSKIVNYQEIKKSLRAQFIIYNSKTDNLQYLGQFKFCLLYTSTLPTILLV